MKAGIGGIALPAHLLASCTHTTLWGRQEPQAGCLCLVHSVLRQHQ